MTRFPCLLAGCLVAVACQTYRPEPVDLAAHTAAFAQRAAAAAPDTLDGGLDLPAARALCRQFHPAVRAARAAAEVAGATAAHAGTWSDPRLAIDVERILEDVEHRWLAGGSLGLELPINGRLTLQREHAEAAHAEALAAVAAAERQALAELDHRWLELAAATARDGRQQALIRHLTDLVQIAERLQAAGALTRLQAGAFRLALARQQVTGATTAATVAAATAAVRQTLGLPPDAPRALSASFHLPPLAANRDPAQAIAVVRLALAHTTAERALALAIRGQWPDLEIAPGFAEEDAQPRATLGLSLPLPLWHGNRGPIATATAARAGAAEALRAGLETAIADAARCAAAAAAAERHQQAVQTTLLPLAEAQLALGRRQAELGQLDVPLLLDALLTLHATHLEAIDAARAAAAAAAELDALFWPTPVTQATTTAPAEEPRR